MESDQSPTPTPPSEPTEAVKTEAPKQSTDPKQKKPRRYAINPMLYELRKYFIYILVGGLIISALVAIVAVLIGDMTDLVGKTIATVAIIVVHSLIALGFVSATSTKQPNPGSAIVINVLFVITVLSLITAMLGTWDIITDSEFIARQYGVFFTAIVTSIIAYGLLQATNNDKPTVIAKNTALWSLVASFFLIVPIIYSDTAFPDLYYRIITAINIVVAVSVVITIIFHWLYMSKHPELKSDDSTPVSLGMLVGRIILAIIGIWIVAGILMGIFGFFISSRF